MAGASRDDGGQNKRIWPLNGTRRFASPITKSDPARSDITEAVEARPTVAADGRLIDAQVVAETRRGVTYASGSVAGLPTADATVTGAMVPDAIPAEFYAIEVGEADTELGGLPFEPAGPRQPVRDLRWAVTMRQFGRLVTWCLPVGVIALVTASVWGWPTPAAEPSGASPGAWLVVTVVGFGLWLLGVVGSAALFAATPARSWSVAALVATLAGTVLLLPVVGVIGLARPAASRAAATIGPDAARDLDVRMLDGAVPRWLAFGGFVLFGVGILALGLALLASRVMNRFDGWLMAGAVAVAATGGFLSWDFLVTLAAMMLLAASLGVAWTSSRLTADGQLRDFP